MIPRSRSFAGVTSPPASGAAGSDRSAGRIAIVVALVAVAAIAAYALTGSIPLSILILAIGTAAFAGEISAVAFTGIFLLLMPLQWLAIALLQFFGVSQYQAISGIKEVILVAAALWFVSRSRHLRLTVPDAVLACAFLCVVCEQLFHFDVKGLRDDWEWALVYLLGRVLVLRPATQILWAKCAVWMCAVLSVLGIWEVEYLGPAPRLLLLSTAYGNSTLPSAFTATGYTGLRAASTMVSPLVFSGLCMVALVLWWVYMRNPIPAVLIGAGLTFTVTRSAVAATVIAVLIVAVRRAERTRIAIFSLVVVLGLAAAIPFLDLSHYLNATLTSGADLSTLGHEKSLVEGVDTVLEHPLGIGAGTVGPRQLTTNPDAISIESSLLTIAIEYGVLGGLLYAGFLIACLWSLWRLRQPAGYAAFSILFGYCLLLAVGPLHFDIPLACWVWLPVGVGVTMSAESGLTPSLAAAPM